MTGAELLARNPHPSEHEIREAFADLICRCGTPASDNAAVKAVKPRRRAGVRGRP